MNNTLQAENHRRTSNLYTGMNVVGFGCFYYELLMRENQKVLPYIFPYWSLIKL